MRPRTSSIEIREQARQRAQRADSKPPDPEILANRNSRNTEQCNATLSNRRFPGHCPHHGRDRLRPGRENRRENRAKPRQSPSRAIRGLLDELEAGFSRGDAKRLAACWTAGGDFAGPAERVEGRENIEKAFRDFFAAHKGGQLKLRLTSLRLASEDLAFVETVSDVKSNTTEGTGENSVLSLVLARRDGRWLIESARETAAGTPSPAQHLKALEWMVGDWSDGVSPQNGLSVRSTCDWTANRTFLIRKFKVEGPDISRLGTEVIGWDPRGQRIRSWVFDSDGGFGENVWVRDGNRWLVRHTGTRPDGSDASATNVLTVVDADTVTVQSKDRMAGGQRAARRSGSHAQASAGGEAPGQSERARQAAAAGLAADERVRGSERNGEKSRFLP